jgi:hypothetical protein
MGQWKGLEGLTSGYLRPQMASTLKAEREKKASLGTRKSRKYCTPMGGT